MNIRRFIFSLHGPLLFVSVRAGKNRLIVMKNGDRLTCEIKGLSAGVLSVKLSYVRGTVGVQWSQVARLESNQLFLVQTEKAQSTPVSCRLPTDPANEPVRIQIASAPEKAGRDFATAARQNWIRRPMSFWRRFDGSINTGIRTIPKAINQPSTTSPPRWSTGESDGLGQASFNSSFASSSGATSASTRNQVDLNIHEAATLEQLVLFWEQGHFYKVRCRESICRPRSVAGIGRYLMNSNRQASTCSAALPGRMRTIEHSLQQIGAQNAAAALLIRTQSLQI